MHRRSHAAFAAVLCSLALPAVASAATKTVSAGPPVRKAPAGVPRDATSNQFFPQAVKVHAGDRVKFTIAGFHLINFPKAGDAAPALAGPDPTHPATGVNDAAGTPFWFNGQGIPVIPSIVGLGSGSGKPYTGAEAIGSGFPAGNGPPKPFVVKFPKAGSYPYFCVLHPGMKGTVAVVAKSKPVPSAKADGARVKAQLARAFTALKQLGASKGPGADTVTAGPDNRNGGVLMRFTPGDLTTKVGTPVTLEMSNRSSEVHTFTFAKNLKAAGKLADKTFVGPLPGTGKTGPPILALDPKYAYPSETPGGPVSYDGSNHGDGFLNSGVLDGDPGTPFPQKFTVSFSKPGTYSYLCAIHTFMTGKITVSQ